MAASGSHDCGQGSHGAGALDTLANPHLAHLPAVDLVVHLHRAGRSGSDFADVALVLAAREHRLKEAEARLREVNMVAAGLPAEAALACNDDQSQQTQAGPLELEIGVADLTTSEIGAADLTAGEIQQAARGLTASEVGLPELPGAGEIQDGEITPGVCFDDGIKATPAEVGNSMPRPCPVRRNGAAQSGCAPVLPVPDGLIEERAVELVVTDVAVRSSYEVTEGEVLVDCRGEQVSEAVAGKRKNPATASEEKDCFKKGKLLNTSDDKWNNLGASANLCRTEEADEAPADVDNRKGKAEVGCPAGASVVASEDDSESDGGVEVEELCFTSAQGWETLKYLKELVSAYEAEYNVADTTQDRLRRVEVETPPPTVQTMDEPQERRVVDLQAKIMACSSTVVEELELWKQRAAEAEAKMYAAFMTESRVQDENTKLKCRLAEAEDRVHAYDDKTTITSLQDKITELEVRLAKAECRIRVADEETANLQDKIVADEQSYAIDAEARTRRATKIEEHLRAMIRELELKVANPKPREQHRSDITGPDCMVASEDNHDGTMAEIGVHRTRIVPIQLQATKKAQWPSGFSFYDMALKSHLEKLKLTESEMDEETLAKQAAANASKDLYLRCWPHASYLPSQK